MVSPNIVNIPNKNRIAKDRLTKNLGEIDRTLPNQLPVYDEGFIISNRIILLAIIMLRSLIFHLRYFYHKNFDKPIASLINTRICMLTDWCDICCPFSFGFAKLADIGLELNAYWSAKYPLTVWIVLPLGLAFSHLVLPLNTRLMLAAAVFHK